MLFIMFVQAYLITPAGGLLVVDFLSHLNVANSNILTDDVIFLLSSLSCTRGRPFWFPPQQYNLFLTSIVECSALQFN